TFNIPSSPGVPEGVTSYTLLAPYNDIEAVGEIFGERGEEIAAVIVEPIAGNMGVVPPKEGFLEGLRELTEKYGAILIFDEVITGFRVSFGGVSTGEKIEPDIITLGKIIGGGLPVGAFCGRREIMGLLAPEGGVYQAGTLSGNPLAMSAGIAALKTLKEENPYPLLKERTRKLVREIGEVFRRKGIPTVINAETAMFSIFFTERERVENLEEVQSSDGKLFSNLFHALLEEGVMLAPSPYEAIFLSTAHDEDVLDETVEAFERAVLRMDQGDLR
ncbi:MAG TPA: aminotransferase class III-fold pyridoxal phosphate-dependent enzyme, partial [Candidatus Latescibacteria bacterium]|nr:aminotransferase class III-fold pyridoxal phosphate-dependent enzyme [Candidatus Latescibacterota bacterium]